VLGAHCVNLPNIIQLRQLMLLTHKSLTKLTAGGRLQKVLVEAAAPGKAAAPVLNREDGLQLLRVTAHAAFFPVDLNDGKLPFRRTRRLGLKPWRKALLASL
jgi:hypothetical protein